MRVASWTAAIGVVGALSGFAAAPVEAQQRGVASVEVVTGYAGYVDDAWDNRAIAGGVVRFALTPRFTIGPEVVYLRGRRGSHEMTVTGTGTFDLVRSKVRRRVVPFVVIGVGLIRQSSLVGGGPGTTGLFHTPPVRPPFRVASAHASRSGEACSSRPTHAWDGSRRPASQ